MNNNTTSSSIADLVRESAKIMQRAELYMMAKEQPVQYVGQGYICDSRSGQTYRSEAKGYRV